MKKRNLFFRYLYLMICCTFLFIQPVHAYIDPSVMTYAIQAVAGIAIALGAVFGIYWRKFRKVLTQYIDLDKLQHKTRESDDLVYHDPNSATDRHPQIQTAVSEPHHVQSAGEKVSFGKDMIPAALLSAAVAFMLGIFAPMEMYMTNSNDFWFSFKMMIPGLLLMFAGIFIILMLVFVFGRILYRGLYNLMLCGGFAIFLATYLQGNVFSKYLPPLDGTEFDWSAYDPLILRSVILYFSICMAVVLLIRFIHMRGMINIIRTVSVFITLILASTLVIVGCSHPDSFRKKGVFISTEGRQSISEGSNFIVLMLDAVDSATARRMMENDEERYSHAFEDFTYYPDTEGAYPYTRFALPYILSGVWNENQDDFKTVQTAAYDSSPLLNRLKKEHWKAGMYSDEIMFSYDSDNIFDFENIIDSTEAMQFSSIWKFIKTELELVWFKYAPYGIKQVINISISEFDELKTEIDQYEPVSFYDSTVKLADKLKQSGLNVESGDKYYRFIHVDGAHNPFNMTEDLRYIEGETTDYDEEVKASLNFAELYLDLLRKSGQYDNSIVIVMADHGYDMGIGGDMNIMRQNPLLMVKGYDEHHAFITSEAPISFEDLQEAYQRLMDGKNGQDVFDAREGDRRERRFLTYFYEKEDHIIEYMQEGYASDLETLRETGNYYDLHE